MANENNNTCYIVTEIKEQLEKNRNSTNIDSLEIIKKIENLPIDLEIKNALLSIACFELVFTLTFLRLALKCAKSILKLSNCNENSRVKVFYKPLTDFLEFYIYFTYKLTSNSSLRFNAQTYKSTPRLKENLIGSFSNIITFIEEKGSLFFPSLFEEDILSVLKNFKILAPNFSFLFNKINKNYCAYHDLNDSIIFDSQSQDWLRELVRKAGLQPINNNSSIVFIRKSMNLKDYQSLRLYYSSDEELEKYSFILKSNNFYVKLFKNRIIELAKKAKLTISNKEVSIAIVKNILDLVESSQIILTVEELLELKQYYSILANNLYYNFFIDVKTMQLYNDYLENDYFLFDNRKFNQYIPLFINEDLSIDPINKKEVFIKKYYQIAFKYIVNHCIKTGYIFTKYDLDDFFINGVNGLALFQYENIEKWGDKITHILRCDDCHQQVEPEFELYLTSNARSQEASFKCPNCGKTYTYSNLLKIYERNCYNSYN